MIGLIVNLSPRVAILIVTGLGFVGASFVFRRQSKRLLSDGEKVAITDAQNKERLGLLAGLLVLTVGCAIAFQFVDDGRWVLTGFFAALYVINLVLGVMKLRRIPASALATLYTRNAWLDLGCYAIGL